MANSIFPPEILTSSLERMAAFNIYQRCRTQIGKTKSDTVRARAEKTVADIARDHPDFAAIFEE